MVPAVGDLSSLIARDEVSSMLKSFAPKDRAEFKDDKVVVTCEFCSSIYQFTPHETGVERRWAKRSVPTIYPRHCC
jgi:Hsp33 protein